MQISNSEYIAIIAAVISIMSLLSALWSASVASKSLSFAISVNKKARLSEFYTLKVEFMNELADMIGVVDSSISDLKAFDNRLVNELESVKSNLVIEIEGIKQIIENFRKQKKDIEGLWRDAEDLFFVDDFTELYIVKSAYYSSYKQIENSARSAKSAIEAVDAKVNRLKNGLP